SISGTLSVTVRAASATQLALTTGTATRTAGTAFSFTVTARDPFGNTVPSYAGTLHYHHTASFHALVLPAASPRSSVVKTFSAPLTQPGPQTFPTRRSSDVSISGTLSVTVRAASATQLALTTGTATRTAGTAFSFTVTAQDPFGNTDPSYAGT